tara:strand:- start:171 stop:320 length:150 start_codon:yes stop_codon:yes gene_type:complete
MRFTIQQAFEYASKLLNKNELVKAEKIYRSILQTQPAIDWPLASATARA